MSRVRKVLTVVAVFLALFAFSPSANAVQVGSKTSVTSPVCVASVADSWTRVTLNTGVTGTFYVSFNGVAKGTVYKTLWGSRLNSTPAYGAGTWEVRSGAGVMVDSFVATQDLSCVGTT